MIGKYKPNIVNGITASIVCISILFIGGCSSRSSRDTSGYNRYPSHNGIGHNDQFNGGYNDPYNHERNPYQRHGGGGYGSHH